MSQHTPGPWTAFEDEIVSERTELHIATVALEPGIINPTEWQANMRLIAAAPDLYESARQIADELASDNAVNSPSLGAMAMLCAAIAKAEGR